MTDQELEKQMKEDEVKFWEDLVILYDSIDWSVIDSNGENILDENGAFKQPKNEFIETKDLYIKKIEDGYQE